MRPWVVVAALLAVCAAKGLWVTAGVAVPPDPDTVRDVGFIQGFIDGNWFGDPATGGAWRWYPPLLHALAAAAIGALGLTALDAWPRAGAWLNLLSPLTFYLMARRLTGAWPAVAATLALMLATGSIVPGDAAAGYTPWTLTPALTWPMFIGAAWLIAERAEAARLRDAVLVGCVLGLVFLAHTVPAVLLSAMVLMLVGRAGWRWVAVAGAVEVLWTLPFLLPLAGQYRLHIANPGPGSWVHPALEDPASAVPNLTGAAVLAWLAWQREALPSVTVLLLAGWAGVCAAFLARHYACAALGRSGGVCGVFVVAAHHYHVYLQAAWAVLCGVAARRLWLSGRGLRAGLAVALAAALVGFVAKPEDRALRPLATADPGAVLDRPAYDWMLRETGREALFVTELPDAPSDMGRAAAAVMAAGRRLVAPPAFHANPYEPWAGREARRLALLAALSLGEACGEPGTFFMVRNEFAAGAGVTAVFRGDTHTIYRSDACGSPPDAAP